MGKWHAGRRPCINFNKDARCDGKHLDKDCPVNRQGRNLAVSGAAADREDEEDSVSNILNAANSYDYDLDFDTPDVPMADADIGDGRACLVVDISNESKSASLQLSAAMSMVATLIRRAMFNIYANISSVYSNSRSLYIISPFTQPLSLVTSSPTRPAIECLDGERDVLMMMARSDDDEILRSLLEEAKLASDPAAIGTNGNTTVRNGRSCVNNATTKGKGEAQERPMFGPVQQAGAGANETPWPRLDGASTPLSASLGERAGAHAKTTAHSTQHAPDSRNDPTWDPPAPLGYQWEWRDCVCPGEGFIGRCQSKRFLDSN